MWQSSWQQCVVAVPLPWSRELLDGLNVRGIDELVVCTTVLSCYSPIFAIETVMIAPLVGILSVSLVGAWLWKLDIDLLIFRRD